MNNDPNQPPSSSYGQQQPPLGEQSPLQSGQPQQPPLHESQPQWGPWPPLPYQQPPYGQFQYGVPPIPNYWPPLQPKKRSRRWLWITLSILGGLLVLGCAGCSIYFALGFSSFARLAGPDLVVQDYYRAIEHQDYTTAYSYLDSNATFTVNGQTVPVTPLDAFTTEATTLDNTLGPVSYFRASIGANDYSSIDVTVTRNGPSYLVHLQLAQVGSDWKITSADGI